MKVSLGWPGWVCFGVDTCLERLGSVTEGWLEILIPFGFCLVDRPCEFVLFGGIVVYDIVHDRICVMKYVKF
jgi:hypothetical protein